jgi:predicted transcriptional regulator
MPIEQDQDRDMTYDFSWEAEQALYARSAMEDAVLLGLLEDDVPVDLIAETLMRSRASLAERMLVLIEEGFLSVEVLV